MRPIKLTMQAFGPYKDTQTLDFGELDNNRLFLIHGTTGAGKTTILDAICYALYGDTSGGERSGSQMRCESADPALPTRVIFDFALGDRYYRALREPQQMNAAKRGTERLVNNAGTVMLWEIDESGAEMEMLAKGVRAVDERVVALVGFSSDQFRQVVVLPQGKFRDLLSSGSDKREEILRQLFRTDRFAAIERMLAERAKAVTKKREELTIQRGTILSTVDAGDDDALGALAADARDAVISTTKDATAAEKTAKAANAAYEAAKSQVQALEDLAAAREELAALEARAPEIEAMKLRVDGCRRSLKVEPAIKAAALAAEELDEATQALLAAESEAANARVVEKDAADALCAEEARGPERVTAHDRVRELGAMNARLADWQTAESLKAASAAELQAAEADVQTAKEEAAAARAAQEQAKAVSESGKEAATRLEKVRAERERDRQLLGWLERLADARGELGEAERALAASRSAEASASRDLEQLETDHADVEQRWRAGQAAALASALIAGEPCPVCGSKDHPAPAIAHDRVDDAELETARTALDTSRAALERAAKDSASADSARAVLAAEIAMLEREIGQSPSLEEVRGRVTVHEETTASLEAALEAAGDAAESLADSNERVVAAEAALVKALGAEKAASAAYASACTSVEMLAKEIPEDFRSVQVLESALADAVSLRDALDAALASAQASAQSAKEARIAADRDLRAATADLGKARTRGESADKTLAAALATHGFSDTGACMSALMSGEDLAATESALAEHHDALTTVAARIAQGERLAASSRGTIDIESLEVDANVASAAYTEALAAQTRAAERLKLLEEVTARLGQLDAEHEAVDEEYALVGVLAAVANGQGQGAKISFQRWVLGAYLDDVLRAATKRLLTMSKGRYQLERQREATDRKRATGLDLAVFDVWANSARPAMTLSGGESFLAALALALGLAETVQEQAGGTRLETVFVDEGFGSLDRDALDLAMEALIELKDSGRLVGVISHVPEMRDAIDARLEVSGGSGGSRARFIVG